MLPNLLAKLQIAEKRFCHGRSDMKCILLAKPIAVLTVTFSITVAFILLPTHQNPNPISSPKPNSMARSFILWLHGLGDSGPANEPIKTLFTSPQFKNTLWSFPSAPSNPVTCNCKSMYICYFFFTGFVFRLCFDD